MLNPRIKKGLWQLEIQKLKLFEATVFYSLSEKIRCADYEFLELDKFSVIGFEYNYSILSCTQLILSAFSLIMVRVI